eukprot:14678745-Alexandrium_andersonii.AAC.1
MTVAAATTQTTRTCVDNDGCKVPPETVAFLTGGHCVGAPGATMASHPRVTRVSGRHGDFVQPLSEQLQ